MLEAWGGRVMYLVFGAIVLVSTGGFTLLRQLLADKPA